MTENSALHPEVKEMKEVLMIFVCFWRKFALISREMQILVKVIV